LFAIPPGIEQFVNETGSLRTLIIAAGAEYTFTQQMRIGDMPSPFNPDCWPTAELRTARSPQGTVLVTYTTTVDDADQAIWSHRLTSAQTLALSGVNGITEMSYPDGSCNFTVWYPVKTSVVPTVTRP